MPILTEQGRSNVWAKLMRGESFAIQFPNPAGDLTKAQHRAVVDALDTELKNQTSTFNLAIPQPQRAILTPPQIAAYLVAIIIERYFEGS